MAYDSETGLFCDEFLGLFGGVDFYGDSVEDLKREGKVSLSVYLDICAKKNIESF